MVPTKAGIALCMLVAPILALAVSPSASHATGGGESPTTADQTRILDKRNAERLLANKGLTLQWIDWDHRGTATVTRRAGLWSLHGRQADVNGPGLLALDGTITEIGPDYFTFQGKITISNTPDPGRTCSADKTWHFAVTQNRRYYRLREFEWCDSLTDYVDIYF
jgi:hypothetical protein